MDLGIAGRRALVWGSRGLGRACALALSREGVEVTIAARNEVTLAAAAAEIAAITGHPVHWVSADITSPEGRLKALAACPDPDILVNNGDGPHPGVFGEWRTEDWLASLQQLMLGPIEMIRLTVDAMVARKFGRIVNISARTVKNPQAELGLSNGPRAGLVGAVAGLARQTVRHNVTINTLLPGIFDTDAQRRHINGLVERTGRGFDEIKAERGARNPAGRYGDPQELGDWCAFLCAARSGFVTGQAILVDGGDYPGLL